MGGRIVLFGATGYTGELTARTLVAAGAEPVLAGRDERRLGELAGELGISETRTAEVHRPETVAALVEPGDVLLTTVGPFTTLGTAALDAAITRRATYIDSTGEPGFIDMVFSRYSRRARAAGVALIPACGFDYVPGNVAASLALQRSGDEARQVAIGYFPRGRTARVLSAGTRASVAATGGVKPRVWRGGRLQRRAFGERSRTFDIAGVTKPAVSIGSSEHFALPRQFPSLRDVDVYLHWPGATRPHAVRAGLAVATALAAIPGVSGLMGRAAHRGTRGPSAEQRAASACDVIAIASDSHGRQTARVHLHGPNAYDFTASILAWAAVRALEKGAGGAGALGPVQAFGLDETVAACARAGLAEVTP